MSVRQGEIVVVDDDADSLKLLVDILAPEGYHVRPAHTGKLALASIAAAPPELILLDMRMPGIDGFEVCRRLKGFSRLVMFRSFSSVDLTWRSSTSKDSTSVLLTL